MALAAAPEQAVTPEVAVAPVGLVNNQREGMEKKLRQKLGKTIIIVLERLDHVPLVHQRRSLSS